MCASFPVFLQSAFASELDDPEENITRVSNVPLVADFCAGFMSFPLVSSCYHECNHFSFSALRERKRSEALMLL